MTVSARQRRNRETREVNSVNSKPTIKRTINKMGRDYCCVCDCKNTSVNSKYKFYKFPRSQWRLIQRQKWIAAINRKNPDGSPWQPKISDKICSSHFIGNEKSESHSSPSYVPTIFPAIYKKRKTDELAAMNRYKRFLKRNNEQQCTQPSENIVQNAEDTCDAMDSKQCEIGHVDRECQVNIFETCSYTENTFICNRYIFEKATLCDAEVQTETMDICERKTVNIHKKMENKACGAPVKTYIDQAVGSSHATDDTEKSDCFIGFKSVKNDEQMRGLTGVSLNNFNFILTRVRISEKCKMSKENCLFIFLMKVKTALTFSALSVLFGVHRTTVSKIFFAILEQLALNTSDLVFWPSKDAVQATMPQCLYPEYSNTRVIIDCTEFKIEVPSAVDNRVYCYSHYKKGFTAKAMIGITPSGFISFKSRVAGGRKTDSQITTESGLVDLLEDGDCVLADKGFPNISSIIDEKGKKVLVVMPHFLERKNEFSGDETQQTYNIAKVRIHVERIMQRLRIYKILDKIPESLFKHIDDILHVCCVLVNLQPPIFCDKQVTEEDNG